MTEAYMNARERPLNAGEDNLLKNIVLIGQLRGLFACSFNATRKTYR